MEAILIAPARRGDSPRLAAMSRRLVESGLDPCWTAERIERHCRHPDSVVLTARAAGSICGFAIMQYGDDAAHLNLLAVEPFHQRQGIGRRAMGLLRGEVWPHGKRLVVEALCANAPAIAFWRAMGYRDYSLCLEILPEPRGEAAPGSGPA